MTASQSEPPADRYRRLAERFSGTVAAMPAPAWGSPSPCRGWTALDVLSHVVDSELGLLRRTGIEVPEAPAAQADPSGVWTFARDTAQAVLDDPERAGTRYEAFGSPTTVAATFGTFMSVDLIVHRWDIARAAGIDATIPREDIELARGFTESMGDLAQTSGAFGPRLAVPDDADPQTRLLALLGRSAG